MSNDTNNTQANNAKLKSFLVKYVIGCVIVDAILAFLIATLNATVLGAGGGAIGAAPAATTVAVVITWILTGVFSFVVIGFIMFVASAMAAIVLAFLFGKKGNKSGTGDSGPAAIAPEGPAEGSDSPK